MHVAKSLLQTQTAFNWLLLLGLAPFVISFTPERLPVLAIIPVLAVLRVLAWRRPWPTAPFNPAMLLLVVMIGVSLWATADLDFSLPKVVGLLYGMALCYAVIDGITLRPAQLWWITAATILTAVGLAGVGALAFTFSTLSRIPGVAPLLARLPLEGVSETAVNANQVGGVLTWVIPLLTAMGVSILIRLRRPSTRRALAGLLLLAPVVWGLLIGCSAALIFTRSRSALIGCLAAVCLLLLIAARRSKPVLIVTAVALVAGLSLLIVYRDALPMAAEPLNKTGLDMTLSGRIEIWSRAVYGIQDFPFTGMGMNMFRRVVHLLYPLFTVAPNTDIGHAHNHLLQAALDLGIPGLIAYLALWIGCGVMLWRTWPRAQTVGQRGLTAGLAGALLAHFVYGITDAIALGAKPGFVLWMLFGLTAGLHQLLHARSAAPPTNDHAQPNAQVIP